MIQYRTATEADMREAAEVHIATQPEYFTSSIGVDLFSKFYTEFLNEDNLFIVAVDDNNGKIIGYCMGNYYGSKARVNWEHKYKKPIIKRLFILCLKFNRLAISRVFGRIFNSVFSTKKVSSDDYFSHLLDIGVLNEYRGKHIASNLIDLFESKCIENAPPKLSQKEKVCTIGAYKWNTVGCEVYKSKGYSIVEESKNKYKFAKVLNR